MTDYTRMTYLQLIAQRAALEAEIEKARDGERKEVIEEILMKMADYEITLAELAGDAGKGAKNDKNNVLPAKYRDPDSGATWSGRGKAPRWIADKPREQFAIE